jgi:hypothetical protein
MITETADSICKGAVVLFVTRRGGNHDKCLKLIFSAAIAALDVFVAAVCFEKPAAAQNNSWCAYYDLGSSGATNCGFATRRGRSRGW